MVTIESVLV